MSQYKRLSADECADLLLKIENPTVLMHARPDGDTVGSAAALMEIFAALGKQVSYACADAIPKRLAFLLSGKTAAESLEGRTLIAIDVASPSQLGGLRCVAEKVTLMIDHHKCGEIFADGYILPEASSAGEVLMTVAELLCERGHIALTKEIAYPLYASISSDTGGFVYSSAAPSTHRRAAVLMESGIDHADINHRLFNSKSPEQIKAEGFVASKLATLMDGRIAYATVSKADRLSLGLSTSDFETAIDVVRTLQNAEIAIFVRENDDGSIRASMRSVGADVAAVAAKLNGGGHTRAAGCSPDAENVNDAVAMITKEITLQGILN